MNIHKYSHFSFLLRFSFVSFLSFFSVFHFAEANGEIIYEGDASSEMTIAGDENGNSTLYFGDTLNNFLQWNADENTFVFSNNVDFGGNQALNMRIEHIASNDVPECTSTETGRLYYNTDRKFSYVCNGTRWKQIDEEVVTSVTPFIKTVSPSSLEITETTTVTISGNGFSPSSTLIIPGFSGDITNFTLVSPSEIIVDITPDTSTLEGDYDFIIDNGGLRNTEWAGNGRAIMNMYSTIDLIPHTPMVPWERTVGVVFAEGSIFPEDTGSSNFDKGGSFGTVPENTNFMLSFNPRYIDGKSSGGYAYMGVDSSDPNIRTDSIDYAFYFKSSTLEIYENGVKKLTYGSYNINDTYKIIRKDNIVSYVINDSVIYVSTINSNSEMVFDSSFSRWIGAENIKLTY